MGVSHSWGDRFDNFHSFCFNLEFNWIMNEKSNNNREQLTYRRHWIGLVVPIFVTILMLLSIVVFIIGLSLSEVISIEEYSPYIILFSGLFTFLAISYFFTLWTFWYLDAWIVTKDKLIDSQLVSFFVHRRSEVPLRQIQDISYKITGTLATIFRCGDIDIQTASEHGSFKLILIENPGRAVHDISTLVKRASAEPVHKQQSSNHINNSINMPLGEILIRAGLLSSNELSVALSEQLNSSKRLGEILLSKGIITDEDLLNALNSQQKQDNPIHLPEIDLSHYQIDPFVTQMISRDIAMKYGLMPISRTHGGSILVAMADPTENKMAEVRSQVQTTIDFITADKEQILEAIHQQYN